MDRLECSPSDKEADIQQFDRAALQAAESAASYQDFWHTLAQAGYELPEREQNFPVVAYGPIGNYLGFFLLANDYDIRALKEHSREDIQSTARALLATPQGEFTTYPLETQDMVMARVEFELRVRDALLQVEHRIQHAVHALCEHMIPPVVSNPELLRSAQEEREAAKHVTFVCLRQLTLEHSISLYEILRHTR